MDYEKRSEKDDNEILIQQPNLPTSFSALKKDGPHEGDHRIGGTC